MEDLIAAAKEYGFSHCAPLRVSSIQVMPQVRQMCASDQCHAYNKSWSCPPACGTLEEGRDRLSKYSTGILVQTVGKLEDSFDYETMVETEALHKENFRRFHTHLRRLYPDLLAIGVGCCTLCRPCTYPNEPCRFPEEMTCSMESYGMLVSQVCKDNGLDYNHGENTVTFTSCYLLR